MMHVTLKVGYGELTVQLSRCFVIRAGGVLGVGKGSQMDSSAIVSDPCAPLCPLSENTSVSRSPRKAASRIRAVLLRRRVPEVATAVIQPVPVLMVGPKPRRCVENKAVHIDVLSLAAGANTSGCIPASTSPKRMPLVRQDALGIRGINDRFLALCEGNQNDRLVAHFRVLPECRAGGVTSTARHLCDSLYFTSSAPDVGREVGTEGGAPTGAPPIPGQV